LLFSIFLSYSILSDLLYSIICGSFILIYNPVSISYKVIIFMVSAKIESLRQALSVSPDNIPLLVMIGEACIEGKLTEEARRYYESVLNIEPLHPEAKLGIIKCLLQTGKFSEALLRNEAMTRDFPGFGSAWIHLARMQAQENKFQEAKNTYQKAIEIDRNLSDTDLENKIFFSQSPPHANDEIVRQGDVAQRGPVYEDYWNQNGSANKSPNFGQVDFPPIHFKDVGGMDGVKEEIRMKIIYPLQNPDLFNAYGKKIGGGVLIYGPPGCGKTLISRATAGEIKAKFISVGIHEILEMWIGSSEKNLHELFEMARADAPAVLFFDEVDALAADRNHMKQSAGRTLINQFLAEMDSTHGQNDGILIIGATNAPWHIDPGFRRPGRFDRILFVPPPDEKAREAIIDILAHGKPIRDLEPRTLAKKTPHFSGADLKSAFDQTIEKSLAMAMKKGEIVPITTKDLLKTIKSTKPSTRSWFDTAKNYALYSNQNGIYDDVLAFLNLKK